MNLDVIFKSDLILSIIDNSGVKNIRVKDRNKLELMYLIAFPKYFGETVLLNQVNVQ